MRHCTFTELPTNKSWQHVYQCQLLDSTFAPDQFDETFGVHNLCLCCNASAVSSTPIKFANMSNHFHKYTHTIQQEQQSKWTFKANFPKKLSYVPTIDAECSGKYSHDATLLKIQAQRYANNIYRRNCVRPLCDAL